jgi:hypothetical protein
MKKLFGLLLLALGLLAPGLAQAANRYAVCTTTCTWDNTSTAMWSTTSGGATGSAAPTTNDTVILDGSTCVGGTTCTITTFAGTITMSAFVMDACTASTTGCILDASVNNTNFSITGGAGYSNNGAGTRTLKLGGGTWTIASNNGGWSQGSTGGTIDAGTSTITSSGTTGFSFGGGGKTWATVVFPAITGSALGQSSVSGSNTFGTLTVTSPNRIAFGNGTTQTVTTMTNVIGTSTQGNYFAGNVSFGAATLSSANDWTCDFCVFNLMTFSGGGTFTATSSQTLGGVSGITISMPSGGGGRGIIGG